MAEEASRKIPEGRLGRFARLASVGMRAGASMLGSGDGSSAAKHAAEVFGTMRGLAAKVGQMASYVDGVVPEQHREAYEGAMKRLRAAAPTSSRAEVRALVESELGASIESLFATWDDAPIASASIGQVHRATSKDGREVAVKVQHPGVTRAIESDLANAGVMQAMIGTLAGKRFKTEEQLDVMRQRFREELDYELEASRLRTFAGFHEDCAQIVIPRVIDDRSTKRVLTTEFMRGMSFDEACAAPEDERRAWVETMWRFVFKGNLVHEQFNADPHPGNYMFQPDGRVVFLDFGCVQHIPKEDGKHARTVHLAACDNDERTLAEASSRLLQMKPGALEKSSQAYMRKCLLPVLESPYLITRPYIVELVEDMKALAQQARKATDDEFFAMPADVLFMNRLQFGFYSVLARMHVEVDYAAVERRFFHLFPPA